MRKKDLEQILEIGLSHGEDFSECFEESTKKQTYIVKNSKLEKVTVNELKGIGIRLAKEDEVVYGSTNHLSFKNVRKLVTQLNDKFNMSSNQTVLLPDLEICSFDYQSNHQLWQEVQKKEFLLKIDRLLREKCPQITQAEIKLLEEDGNVVISNNLSIYKREERILTRLIVMASAKEGNKTANHHVLYGAREGYSYIETLDIEKITDELSLALQNKLKAFNCPGKKMPVIIGPGFGAVIFHEACGHALEATSVATGVSVLSDKLGKKIASDKVTLIDDGSQPFVFGSTVMDDEGRKTQRNVLIEKGILKNYLVDYLNGRKMNQDASGSSRRENYRYAPTSRMNNTYLEKGEDSISDMIESISYGLYAKSMNGGCVEASTGDFTFSVLEGYLIENGKITTPVQGVSLIGNTKDILYQIEMVSDNLSQDTGYCGASSGYVPVTVGQPTIKVKEILVGGSL